MTDFFLIIVKWFYVIGVSLAAAMVINIVLFFSLSFLLAPAGAGEWIDFYFGSQDGLYFVGVTILLSLPIIPFTKNMNIVRHYD